MTTTHCNDEAAGRISTLDGLTKAELNNQLFNPLSASKLKKTSRDALLEMIDVPAAKPKRAPKATTHAPKGELKTVRKGTKRETLLRTSHAGATAADIDALCVKKNGEPWSKSAAASARGVFWRGLGYGTRVDGDKYFVTLPKGVTIEDCIVD